MPGWYIGNRSTGYFLTNDGSAPVGWHVMVLLTDCATSYIIMYVCAQVFDDGFSTVLDHVVYLRIGHENSAYERISSLPGAGVWYVLLLDLMRLRL